MYIMSGDGKQIINSDFVERFAVASKDGTALVIASYSTGDDKRPCALERYRNTDEAKTALADMMASLASDQACYYMPPSSYYAEPIKKDARVKRRGGS